MSKEYKIEVQNQDPGDSDLNFKIILKIYIKNN